MSLPSRQSAPPPSSQLDLTTPNRTVDQFTNGRALALDSLWTILGRGAPLVIALISIPVLLHGLGASRFGVLNLGWVVVGYLNLFDLGLGRALTMVAAEKLGTDREHEVPSIFWKSIALLVLLGVIGAFAGIVISRWLAYSVLTIPQGMKAESLHVFYLLSLWLPIQISESGLRGMLGAYRKFRFLSTLGMIMGIFSYVAPMMMLPFTHRLTLIIAVILVGRGVLWLTLFFKCLSVLPRANRFRVTRETPMRSLLRVGGWMTVTNILSPLMDFSDRFLVGAILSVSAVAYYSAPFDLVIKLMIIPTAIAAVIFPTFAASFTTAREKASQLFSSTVRLTYLILLAPSIILVLFAEELLRFWLGKDFSGQSTHVLQILVIGVFAKCVAEMSVALVQGGGRSDLYARLHMAEFPVYIILIWLLVRPYGINGAAIAWTSRVILDAAMLMLMSHRMLGKEIASMWQMFITSIGTMALLLACTLPMPLMLKIPVAGIALSALFIIAFTRALTAAERAMVHDWLATFEMRMRRGLVSQ